jgi:hypothetical protein
MASQDKSNDKDDNRFSRIRLAAKWFKFMSGIVLVALLGMMILKKAMDAIKEAQSKLADLATAFETKIQYAAPAKVEVDRVQDSMDEERKRNEVPQH